MANRTTELTILVNAKGTADKVLKSIGTTATKAGTLAQRAFRKVSTAAVKMAKAVKRGALGIVGLAKKVTGFLTPGIGQLLIALGGLALFVRLTVDAQKFGEAMSEVATIVDTTTVSMAMMSRGVLDLARAMGSSELDLAAALYQSISAGVDAGALSLDFLAEANRLAIAGLADTTSTVNLLTGTMNAYGFSVDKVTRVSDIFFTTVKRGKTSIPEMATAMSQATPLAAQLGVRLEELTGALAAITLGGTPTTEAITQISSVLRALLKKSDEVDKAFKTIGHRFDDTTVRTLGLQRTLDLLTQATGGSEIALITLLGRAEAMNATLNLTGRNAARFTDIMRDMENAAGATGEAFDKRMSDPAVRARVMLNSLRITFQGIGRDILQAIARATEFAGGLGAIEDKARIVSDVLGTMAARGVEGLGHMLGVLDRVVKSMGGAEQVSGTLVAAVKVMTSALRVAFFSVVETIEDLIAVIGLLPEAIRSATAAMPLIGERMANEIQKDLDRAIAKQAEFQAKVINAANSGNGALMRTFEKSLAFFKREASKFERELERAPIPQSAITRMIRGLKEKERPALAEATKQLADDMANFMDRFGQDTSRAGEPPLAAMLGIQAAIAALEQFERVSGAITRRVEGAYAASAAEAERLRKASGEAFFADLDRRIQARIQSVRDAVAFMGQRDDRQPPAPPAPPALASIASGAAVASINMMVVAFEDLNRSMGGTATGVAAIFDTMERGSSVTAGMAQGFRNIKAQADAATGAFFNFNLGQDIVQAGFDGLLRGVDGMVDAFVDGTGSMSDAMKGMAKSILKDILKIIAKMLVMKAISALIGFATGGTAPGAVAEVTPQAMGGVMRGSIKRTVPFHKMAQGGIARGPSLALMGENSRFRGEAFVPLPDGKSIPVQNMGGGGGPSNVTFNITANDTRGFDELLTDRRALITGMIREATVRDRGFRGAFKDVAS